MEWLGNILDWMRISSNGETVDQHDQTCETDSQSATSSRDVVPATPGTAQTNNPKPISTSDFLGAEGISGDVNIVGTSSGPTFVGGWHTHLSPNTSSKIHTANIRTPIDLPLLQQGLKQYYSCEEEWYHPIEGLNTRPHLLEDYYVELQFGEIHRNGFKPEGTLPIQEVFLNRKNKNRRPTRILVTGEAGYGKSTFCKKLAHDWVEQCEYISRFEIVILIRLRGVATTIEDSVVQLCNEVMGSNYEQKQVLQCLWNLGDKFLLILDGYDELNESAKTSLTGILEYGKSGGECFFRLATVLLTTRPDTRLDDETNLMTTPVVGMKIRSNLSQSFEMFLNIDELTEKSRISFIENYFKDKDDPAKIVYLAEIVRRTEMRLTRSPLLLHIMCYLHEHGSKIDAKKEFWEQYLQLICTRAISREVDSSLNLNEQVFNSIVLQLGEVFLQHLQRNELYIKERDIKDIFVEKAPFVMSCGLLQKVFSYKPEDSKMLVTPHKTFMEYLALKYINVAFDQAVNSGNELNFLRSLLNTNVVIGLMCTVSISSMSVIVLFRAFSLQFSINVAEPTSDAPEFWVNASSLSDFLSQENSVYILRLFYLQKEEAISAFENYLSRLHPKRGDQIGFKIITEILGADVIIDELSLLCFFISNNYVTEFCNVMKLSDARFEIAILECLHSPNDLRKVYEPTECNVEQICSVLLSKPDKEVHCSIAHALREDQLTELLINKYEGAKSNLELLYPSNIIHDMFLRSKGLQNVSFQSWKAPFSSSIVTIALRPEENCQRELLLTRFNFLGHLKFN